jgi:hypothetical protein
VRRRALIIRALAFSTAAAFVALGAACQLTPPKPGDACSGEGELACFDPQTALECLGGVRVGLHCGGPSGCHIDGRMIWCDQSLASDNDLCLAPHLTQFGDGACAPDRRSMLACTNGRFQAVSSCRGPQGCKHAAGNIACDNSAAEPGDLCRKAGNLACSLDGGRVLTCSGRKFEDGGPCGGPERCKASATQVSCDQSVASEGEPCHGGGACSVDHASMLGCEGGKRVRAAACRGPAGCALVGPKVHCDTSVAAEADPCEGTGASCSADGRTLLACSNGKFKVERACPHRCEVKVSENVVSCR